MANKESIISELQRSTSRTSSDDDVSLGVTLEENGKQFSVESVKTLDQIQTLRQSYEIMLHKAEQIHKSTDMGDYKSVSRSKSQLAQLLGNIEKLQFNQLDAVSTVHLESGKMEAKTTRRELNAALDKLQEFVSTLYKQYDAVPPPHSPSPTASTNSQKMESTQSVSEEFINNAMDTNDDVDTTCSEDGDSRSGGSDIDNDSDYIDDSDNCMEESSDQGVSYDQQHKQLESDEMSKYKNGHHNKKRQQQRHNEQKQQRQHQRLLQQQQQEQEQRLFAQQQQRFQQQQQEQERLQQKRMQQKRRYYQQRQEKDQYYRRQQQPPRMSLEESIFGSFFP